MQKKKINFKKIYQKKLKSNTLMIPKKYLNWKKRKDSNESNDLFNNFKLYIYFDNYSITLLCFFLSFKLSFDYCFSTGN